MYLAGHLEHFYFAGKSSRKCHAEYLSVLRTEVGAERVNEQEYVNFNQKVRLIIHHSINCFHAKNRDRLFLTPGQCRRPQEGKKI